MAGEKGGAGGGKKFPPPPGLTSTLTLETPMNKGIESRCEGVRVKCHQHLFG